MPGEKFAKWKQKVLLGASLKVIAPTGQCSPTKLVNWGINRWAFKPEFGYSERWGNWLLDAYAGVWFYTVNSASYDVLVPKPQSEGPIGSFEGHLSYDFKTGTWISLDANFWWGGVTSLSGIQNLATRPTSSRIGGTAARRVSKHQSLKVSYRQWHLHSFRRQLSDCAGGLAVFVARLAQEEIEVGPELKESEKSDERFQKQSFVAREETKF